MTDNERRRFGARQSAMTDNSLSFGARVLYWYLDDLANFRGFAWPRQDTIAEKFCVSVRQIQRWYSELDGKYLTIKRGYKTSATSMLNWNATKMSPMPRGRRQKCRVEMTKMSPIHLIEDSVLFTHGLFSCEKCEDLGFRQDRSACDCVKGREVAARRARRRA